MRGRACISLATLGLVVAASVAVAGALPKRWMHWSHYREIRLGAGAGGDLVRVGLPEPLFESARTDLADLRILDADGAAVGYAVYVPGRGPASDWRAVELSDAGFVPGEHTQLVADVGDEAVLHNAVEVTLPRSEEELFSWAEVAASADRETWRVVRERAPLYRFRSRGFDRSVVIDYPRTRDRWLRLRLLRGDREIAVERLRVCERSDEATELTPIRRPLFLSPDSPAGESWWQPSGEMPRVPVAAVRVATDRKAFHRPVEVQTSDDGKTWREVGRGQVYRYGLDGEGGAEETGETPPHGLQVDVRNAAAPYWRVLVLDRDDPPIEDLAVTLLQQRRYLVFRPRPDTTYRLLYGNPRAEAPEHELGEITSRERQANALLAELGAEQANDAWVSSEPFTERHPILMWAALGLAVAVIGWMALRSLRAG